MAVPVLAFEPAVRPEFRAVYDAHFDFVWRSLRRFGVPERNVDDAAQDVFVVVHRKLDEYDPTRPLKPWLAGIAVRVASDHRRRASNVHEVMEEVEPEPVATLDSDVAARQIVRRLLDRLDPDRRAVFVLHELEGMTMPEIAEATGAPLNTCYSRLRLAREQLEKEVRS